MTNDSVFGAVIVAAGGGSRMRGLDKLFTEVAGKPLLAHAVAPFQESPALQRIVLVVSAENVARGRAIAGEWGLSKVTAVVPGGERRQDSVRLGVEALGQCDYVAVHDGARPLVDGRLIARGLEAVRETGAAVPAVPLADTVKEVGRDARVVRTVDRTRLWAVQTPQFFRYDLLLRAHRDHPEAVTDDAALLEAMGLPVKIFPGDKRNIKVTTPEDLELVRALLDVGTRMDYG
jgi:2-C-methyl-D-erythritol 4-phosphate cytidylyltransferase